jgi:rhomboid protease GluP
VLAFGYMTDAAHSIERSSGDLFFETSDVSALTFQVRKDRQPQKTRRTMWLTFVLMLSTALLFTSLMKISWQVTAFVLLVPAGLIWWSVESTLKKRFPPGIASLQLTPFGMSSPLLQGEHHSFTWSEVTGMTVKTVGNVLVMDFELHPATPGGPVRRGRDFLGRRKAPRLPLDMFDAAAQEAIVDAVNAAMVPGRSPTQASSENPIAVERRFKDHLHALTPRTWVTWTLVAVNVAVWCAMLATSHDAVRLTSAALLEWGGNSAWEVQHGAWWRLGTSMFLHGGALHLILNMAALLWLGPLAERLFGPRQFLLLYGIAGLTGSALSLSFSAQAAISVGASGAIFGVAGALMTTVWRHHGRLPALFGGRAKTGLTFYVFYSLSHGFGQTGVDNAAHVGGLVAGCLMAWLLPIRVDEGSTVRSTSRPMVWGALAGSLLVAVLATAAPVSQIDHRASLETDRTLQATLERFQALMRTLNSEVTEHKAGGARAWAADERSRVKHAPQILVISEELAQARLAPTDPRLPLIKTTEAISKSVHEMLVMPSIADALTGNPVPRDAARYAALEAEATQLFETSAAQVKALKARKL